jgi:hypothetical protein
VMRDVEKAQEKVAPTMERFAPQKIHRLVL